MANRFAIVNGNFNDTATWSATFNGAGGASVPGAGDSAMANAKTVNITANVTCTDLRNDTQGSAVAGGGFVVTNGNVTASASTDIVTTATPHGLAIGDRIVFASLVGGIGLVSGTTYRVHASNFGTTTFSVALNADGTTLVDITSDVVSGSVTKLTVTITASVAASGTVSFCSYSGLGTVYIIGNIYGSGGTSGIAFNLLSLGRVIITGNLYGYGQYAYPVQNTGNGTVTVTGNLYGGTAYLAAGLNNAATGSVVITGNVYGHVGSALSYGCNNATGDVTITGNVYAGLGPGLNNVSTGSVSVIGDVIASSASPAIGSTNAAANNRISGNIINAANGMQAIYAQRYSIVTTPTNTYIRQSLDGVSTFLNYYQDGAASSQSGQAAASDVRYGTAYGPTATLTGTCRVPAASSVAYGTPVDSTTGVAVLTKEAIWDSLTSAMTTSGSIGERLKNVSTVDTTGTQLASFENS